MYVQKYLQWSIQGDHRYDWSETTILFSFRQLCGITEFKHEDSSLDKNISWYEFEIPVHKFSLHHLCRIATLY